MHRRTYDKRSGTSSVASTRAVAEQCSSFRDKTILFFAIDRGGTCLAITRHRAPVSRSRPHSGEAAINTKSSVCRPPPVGPDSGKLRGGERGIKFALPRQLDLCWGGGGQGSARHSECSFWAPAAPQQSRGLLVLTVPHSRESLRESRKWLHIPRQG